MGYTTEFDGHVTVTPPLNAAEVSFLTALSETRRMNRTNGPLFVQGSGPYGQGRDDDIIDHNEQHPDQPGLWCQWQPSDDGTIIQWDGGEKFYNAAEWMKYIVTKLLAPEAREYIDEHLEEDWRLTSFTCDHTVNGVIDAEGEESSDVWRIIVTDNVVKVSDATLSFNDPRPV